MKKIIGGKMYNTETAKLIGSDSYGQYGNFEFFEERLYRKKTGEYFIYGYGGAKSKYSEQIDSNTWAGGENITPIVEIEAKEWCERHLSADDYIAEFGEVEE